MEKDFFMLKQTDIFKLIRINLFVLFLLLIAPNAINAQETVEVLYEQDMKYTGSSTKPSLQYRYILEYLIELMEKNPTWKLHIRGHVCCGPDQKTSAKRAKNVYKYMLKRKIDPSRLSYKGYNDTKPIIFPEKTEEDAHTNRRVDFMITKPSN